MDVVYFDMLMGTLQAFCWLKSSILAFQQLFDQCLSVNLCLSGAHKCWNIRTPKNMISTTEQHAKHPFADQNTQQMDLKNTAE